MKAAVHTKYGFARDVITIKNVKKPKVNLGEILVKVKATTVNRTDCGFLRADPFVVRFFAGIKEPKITISGSDFAGIIEDFGEDVKFFKKGDKIFGFHDQGLMSHAEYLVISEKKAIAKIPKGITFKQAAASCEGAHYAYNFIKKIEKKKGAKILVNGGTGAIGSASIQILKFFDANVTATCDTKNIKLVKSLGADKIIDKLEEDFTKSREKYDYVLDSVGKSTFSECKPILKKRGIYISSDLGPKLENTYLPISTLFFSEKKVIFPIPTDIKQSINFIQKLLEEKKFRPLIDKEYNLEEIVKAFEYVESGKKIGNVIINI